MKENLFIGLKNRILQVIAQFIPGARTIRPFLHKLRGVKFGGNAWISYNVILETSRPYLISIGNDAAIGIGCTLIAHFREATTNIQEGSRKYSIIIEDRVFIGPCCVILPNVTIGYGSVISAGSVVTKSIPPNTMVSGNPAKPIARCNIPLTKMTSLKEFYKNLKPLK